MHNLFIRSYPKKIVGIKYHTDVDKICLNKPKQSPDQRPTQDSPGNCPENQNIM